MKLVIPQERRTEPNHALDSQGQAADAIADFIY
jgi:hypothetical protein